MHDSIRTKPEVQTNIVGGVIACAGSYLINLCHLGSYDGYTRTDRGPITLRADQMKQNSMI